MSVKNDGFQGRKSSKMKKVCLPPVPLPARSIQQANNPLKCDFFFFTSQHKGENYTGKESP
jgi:hypothetical protein